MRYTVHLLNTIKALTMSQFKLFNEYSYQGLNIAICVRDSCVDPIAAFANDEDGESIIDSIESNEVKWFDINVSAALDDHILAEWVLTSLCYPTYEDAFADINTNGSRHVARVVADAKVVLEKLVKLHHTVI